VSDEPAPASRRGLTVLPAGPDALLLEVSGAAESGIAEVLALHERVRAAVDRGEGPWPGVSDVVPAARTVLLHTRPGADLPALGAVVLASMLTAPSGARAAQRLPVATLRRVFALVLYALATRMLFVYW